MVLGTIFPQTTSYVEEKQEQIFTYTANVKMPTFTSKRQATNVENGRKIVVTFAVLRFT